MALVKRLDSVEIIVPSIAQASATYSHNFDLRALPEGDAHRAVITIGGAKLKLVEGPPSAQGLAGLWLEAEDVDQLTAALDAAALSYKPLRRAGGLRILEIDRRHTNQVALFIFDRRP